MEKDRISRKENALYTRAAKIIKVADDVSGHTLGKFYSHSEGNFAPAKSTDIIAIFNTLHVQPQQQFIDLGSGDGRWVFVASMLGLKAEGYEISSQINAVANQVKDRL